MTDRALIIRTILSRRLIVSVLQDHSDDGWLEEFPGGITTRNTGVDSMVFHLSVARIMEHGAHLSDSDFVEFCEAIEVWQFQTKVHMTLLIAPDLVTAMFSQDFPNEYRRLAAVADHAGIEIVTFLGAQSREQQLRWDDPPVD